MDSDSDIEIISSTQPPTQRQLPPLDHIITSTEFHRAIENEIKASPLSPIPKRSNLKRSATDQLQSPSPIPTQSQSYSNRQADNKYKYPSLSPIPTPTNAKLSAHNESASHSISSIQSGSQRKQPPHSSHRSNSSNYSSKNDRKNHSNFASQVDHMRPEGTTQASNQSKADHESGELIGLSSSPLSSCGFPSDVVNARQTKGNERNEDSSLSDLDSPCKSLNDETNLDAPCESLDNETNLDAPCKSLDNGTNHSTNLTSKSASQEKFAYESLPLNPDPHSEAEDVQLEQIKNPLVYLSQDHKKGTIVNLASSPFSTSVMPSIPTNLHATKSNEKDQIDSREKVPIELDSDDSLSELDFSLGTYKPSSQSKSATENKQGYLNNGFLTKSSSRRQAIQKDASLAAECYLQPHRSKSILGNPHPVVEMQPRSRSVPQKLNEQLVNPLSEKGKGKQVAQHFNNIEHDYDHLSHLHMPQSPSSVDLDPLHDPAPRRMASSSRLEKQSKTAESKLAREAKKAEKEQEKLQNRLNREANKLTLNRKETVSEVRMWVPKSLKQSKLHPLTKACEVLVEKISSTEDCRMNLPGEIDDESSNEPTRVVRWIRTTNKEWDEESGTFIPLSIGKTNETSEPTVLTVWTGKEVDEIIASGPDQLLKKAEAIQAHYPQDQLFIVISGLEAILKAEKKREDAMIANEARARLANQRNELGYNVATRRNSSGLPKNDPHKILKELEILKIITKAFIIRVEDKNEFANWLWEMTLEIGVRPYKARRQDLKSALRLEVTGTKGTNNEDTYIKMLSSLTRVTENEAKGIVSQFPTLKILYQSWERGIETHGIQWAEDMLIGCSKSNSITGINSGRKIGRVTSKRIFDILYNVRNGDACI